MSKVYDNWERLVEATLKRENLRQIALAPSFNSISDDSSEIYPFLSDVQGDLARTILFADEIIKTADTAAIFTQECMELKSKTRELAGLLRQAMDLRIDLYGHPLRRVVSETNRVLYKALALVLKCRGLVKRVFFIISAESFRRISLVLENSISDFHWLIGIFASLDDPGDKYFGLPPIATIDPTLGIIWEKIAILYSNSMHNRSQAAAELVFLARHCQRYGKLIVEEGGVVPLLKLLEEGEFEGQENAARAIGLLGKDPETIVHMIHAEVCLVFEQILKEGAMKVQAAVAWAISELAMNYPKCQDLIARHNIVMLLVRHLAFNTLQEHRLHSKTTSSSSNAAVALPNNNNNRSNAGTNDSVIKSTNVDDESHISRALKNKQPSQTHNAATSTMALKGGSGVIKSNGNNDAMLTSMEGRHHQQSFMLFGPSNRAREMEDPATRANIKAMAARALRYLAKGNSSICQSITDSIGLLCFAVLLEKGPKKVQYNCALALMEITTVAEEDYCLRTSAFKPNSPVTKIVLDQLFMVLEKADNSKLLIPCVKAIGNLSTTFGETEKRMISPLVKLLNHQEVHISAEACVALKKFAWSTEHSKAIIDAGGAEHIIQLVYFGEQIVQRCATLLLRCLALHVPDIEELAHNEVFTVLRWAENNLLDAW